MSTKEDLEKAEAAEEEAEEQGAEEAPAEVPARASSEPPAEAKKAKKASDDAEGDTAEAADEADEAQDAEAEGDDDDRAPLQLGYTRYVYAAFMAGALGVAFLASKIGHLAWFRLSQWKPELGDPKDELVIAVSGIIGAGTALYYWRKPEAREYANEVAEELSKVTWPSRKEVTNSTAVVIATTLAATVFFALMDRFWSFVTNLVYGS